MVTVRYWAGARAAAGCAEERLAAATIGELLSAVAARHAMAKVLAVSSLLIDGTAAPLGDTGRELADGAVVDVLPPFAGGSA